METPILNNPRQIKSNLWIGLTIWAHIIILNILFVILIYMLNIFLNINSLNFWIYVKEVINILILLFAVWYGLRTVFKRTAVNPENYLWVSFFTVFISLLIQILIVLFVVFAKTEISILGINQSLIWLGIFSLILQDIVVFISVFYFLKRKTQEISVENFSKYTLVFIIFLLLTVSANATTYYFISKWGQELLQSQDFQKKLILISRPDENPYYSISLPTDWKIEKNDIGAGLDKRLIGYTYGPYVNLNCGTVSLAECNPTAPSTVNLSVFVYENSKRLNARDYVKTLYKSFPNPAKLSNGFVSTTFEIIPKTEIRGEGVKIINYFIGGDRGYQYYFTNSGYIYWILVDYKLSKVDTEKGIKESYQKLSEEYQLFIDNEIDSFTPKENEIISWKTYRNEKYGFEMKIPPEISKLDWHISEKVYVGGSVFYGAIISKPFVSLDIQVPDFQQSSPRDITLFTVYIFSNQDANHNRMQEYIPSVPISDQPLFSFDKVVQGRNLTFALSQNGFQDCESDLCNLLPLREKIQDSFLVINSGGNEVQLSGRHDFINDIARIEFNYPISWPVPVTPPNRTPYNLPDYKMKRGNTFFTALVGNAYIEFMSMKNATSKPLSLEEKLKNFDSKGNVKTNKNGFRYIIYTAETERAGKTMIIEFEDKYNIGYNVSFVIPAVEFDLHKTEWESVISSLLTF